MTGDVQRLEAYRRKRDFKKTAEPAGTGRRRTGTRAARKLQFVVQKHASSHLHYDLRLEMDGVMRSWAVPKGPSLDPKVRRLAMEVEDHPIEYNEFEGVIPEGEYGGGTVMLWDRGTYMPDELKKGEEPEKAARRGYRQGKLSFTVSGERLKGSFALIRTAAAEGGPRSKWLLVKHKDDDADPRSDIAEAVATSVATDRTMAEITEDADGKGGHAGTAGKSGSARTAGKRASRSNPSPAGRRGVTGNANPQPDFSSLLPMLARTGTEPPSGSDWVFEPKYDGIRVLAFVTRGSVALVTRNGHDKAKQFPEVTGVLEELAADYGKPLVLDGELVSLQDGSIGRFERLQGRTHLRDPARITQQAKNRPAALVAFDILVDGKRVLMQDAFTKRREHLERVLAGRTSETLRISEVSEDRKQLARRGKRQGWEGIMAKRADSRYRAHERTSNWLKLKLENRQELVVGGWTEPRKSREFLGAILLGYYDSSGELQYAGHTGTGFSRGQLAEMHRRLSRLERKTPPFHERPETNEKAHWTTPQVVVEVKFNEWTRDGKLRQSAFLGFRDDKDPRDVVREPPAAGPERLTQNRPASKVELDTPTVRKIRHIAEEGGEGELKLGKAASVPVTNLGKTFFPATGHSKEDLLVYYARLGHQILPWMKDRPLVLRRFPDGVEGESFYQQAAPETVPPGVRVDTLRMGGKRQRRLVGGNLTTLLYTIQLGAISFDPWHSRADDLESADYAVIDLDPGPGADFHAVVQVARRVKEEMDDFGLHGALKTSGSAGMHIYLPLPRKTPLDTATLVARIVAARVAEKYPKEATIERMTKKRPRGTVYVDFLQNILGKSVAGVYAVRARSQPTVSTPLDWEDLTDDLDPGLFTIDTVPARVADVGDLWKRGMSRPNSLERLLRSAK